jgi:hypothetical protein
MDGKVMWALIIAGILVLLILVTKIPSMGSGKGENVALASLAGIGAQAKALGAQAKQDNNLLLALVHNTSALARINVLQELDKSHKLAKKLDLDIESLRLKLQKSRDDVIGQITGQYPNLRLPFDAPAMAD